MNKTFGLFSSFVICSGVRVVVFDLPVFIFDLSISLLSHFKGTNNIATIIDIKIIIIIVILIFLFIFYN